MSDSLRMKVCTLVAILCGSLAAASAWRALHPTPSATDAQARAFGFVSAVEESSADAFLSRMLKNPTITAEDVQEIRSFLRSGSRSARMHAIVSLGFVQGLDQHRNILKAIDSAGMTDEDRAIWRISFTRWIRYQKSPGEAAFLTSYPNPKIASLAREIVDEKP